MKMEMVYSRFFKYFSTSLALGILDYVKIGTSGKPYRGRNEPYRAKFIKKNATTLHKLMYLNIIINASKILYKYTHICVCISQ